MEEKHIFLSYRSTEVDFALRLAADLKNAGVNLWMDRLDIKPGDDWVNALQKAVTDSAAIVAVVSPEYVQSKYCKRELSRADRIGRPIFPVLLRPVPDVDWPMEIERSQYIDFSDWQDEQVYQTQLNALVQTLKQKASAQVKPIPDAETRYLTSLIARLESHKGVLEFVELSGVAGTLSSDEEPIRPKPLQVDLAGGGGSFTLLKEQPQPGREPLHSITQAVERYPRFVLIGPAGAGKTTVVQRLALQIARARQVKKRTTPMPLLINLAAWQEGQSLAEFLKSNWPFDSDPVELLSKGRIFLFLDGLNEMGAAGSQNTKLLREWLDDENAPQRIVVTCRTTDYTGDLTLSVPTIVAEAMDEKRIRHFVINYLGKDEAAPLLARVLPDDDADLDDARHLFQLAQNPFLLTVLMLVYLDSPNGDLPRNMGLLIKRLIMALWQREHTRQTPGWVPFEEMEAAFSQLAYAVIDDDKPNIISREYALKYLGSEALLRVSISVNIITSQSENVHFNHQLILEYFAAVGLEQVGLPTRLTRPRFDAYGGRTVTKWDQVIVALSGIASNSDAIVRSVAEVDPYLALECIASGIRVTEYTYQQVVSQLTNMLEAEGVGGVAAVRALDAVGDESAIDLLMDTMRAGEWNIRCAATWALREIRIPQLPGLMDALHDWEQDIRDVTATAVRQIGSSAIPMLLDVLYDDHWSMRRGAAWALGEIGDKAAVPGLVMALQDEDGLVRREAAEALGWIRDPAAIPAVLESLHDQDWRVRKTAAETLGWIGAPALNGLLEALADDSSNVRRVAAEALGRIGDASAVPGLLEALYDDNIDVRGTAIESLGWLKSAEAVPELTPFLWDTTTLKFDDRRLCDIAADALEHIHTPGALNAVQNFRSKQKAAESVPEPAVAAPETSLDDATRSRLMEALKDDDGLRRWQAVKALAAFKDQESIQVLLQALGDEDALVCDAAGEALAKIGAPSVPGLLNALLDVSPNVRGAAIEALGKIGDTDAVSGLIECLSDTGKPWLSDERICDLAARALENIGTKEALNATRDWRRVNTPLDFSGTPEEYGQFYRSTLPELIKALTDEDWSVRHNAAKALRDQAKNLSGTSHASVLEMFSEAMQSGEWFVRWAVAEALAWVGNPAAVPVLCQALKDDNWMVRVAASRALLEIGDGAAVPSLVEALDDKHSRVRQVAAEVLGLLGHVSALDGLLRHLHDSEPLVRRAAAEALGAIGDSRANSDLLSALDDHDAQVRWTVTEALGKVGDANAIEKLIALLQDTYTPDWEEKPLCELAAEALQHIGTPEALQAVTRWRYGQLAQD
jgi:HEAT repeat protein